MSEASQSSDSHSRKYTSALGISGDDTNAGPKLDRNADINYVIGTLC